MLLPVRLLFDLRVPDLAHSPRAALWCGRKQWTNFSLVRRSVSTRPSCNNHTISFNPPQKKTGITSIHIKLVTHSCTRHSFRHQCVSGEKSSRMVLNKSRKVYSTLQYTHFPNMFLVIFIPHTETDVVYCG